MKRVSLEFTIGDDDVANLLLVVSSDPIEHVEASATSPPSGHKRNANGDVKDANVPQPKSRRHSVEDDDVHPIQCGKEAKARP